MDTRVRKYLSKIGSIGGKKSKRKLDPLFAKDMVRVREAKKAFREYYARCFWSYDQNLNIEIKDVPWVARQLKKNGDLRAWKISKKLCP